jgi:hypothetical protein
MMTLLVILKALVEIAGLALIGQGILFVLAGAGREQNVFYRMLRTITTPVTKLVRLITPRRLVPDAFIGLAAFFLMAGVYLALLLEQRNQCLADLSHPSCERLVVDLTQRCVAGADEACAAIKRGSGLAQPLPPASVPPATKP